MSMQDKIQELTNSLLRLSSGDTIAASETPIVAGIAAVGTSTKYAREDHVHPAQTNVENATKATQDGSGNEITSTYMKISGSRGKLAGYQTTGTDTTVSDTSTDTIETSSAVTVSNGTAGTSWTKVVRLTAASPSVTLSSGWSWMNGEAPTLEQNGFLVCCWCGSAGIANFVSKGA